MKVQQNTREQREKEILECAFLEFSQRGIDNTAMTDIAKTSKTGVASIYRYFGTKEEIAIRCIIQAWEKLKVLFMKRFTTDSYLEKNGLDQCEELFSVFLQSYEKYSSFYLYVYEFDLYVRRHHIKPERLTDYESVIKSIEKTALTAINKGFSDHSIKESIATQTTAEELYLSISHALFSLVQKLAVSGHILEMDSHIHSESEIQLVLQLFKSALKA
jgi:AcrR family transcriptional regulator